MRCGIDCILYLLKDLNTLTCIEIELSERLNEKGLSIYVILEVLHMFHIPAKAFQSFFLPKSKCILYLKQYKGHYIVLDTIGFYYAYIYDPIIGNKKIAKWKLYLLWSHKYIML